MSAVKQYHDVEVDGIDHSDSPDYCDAYICSASVELEDGSIREATDSELDELNEDGDFVYEHVLKRIY